MVRDIEQACIKEGAGRLNTVRFKHSLLTQRHAIEKARIAIKRADMILPHQIDKLATKLTELTGKDDLHISRQWINLSS